MLSRSCSFYKFYVVTNKTSKTQAQVSWSSQVLFWTGKCSTFVQLVTVLGLVIHSICVRIMGIEYSAIRSPPSTFCYQLICNQERQRPCISAKRCTQHQQTSTESSKSCRCVPSSRCGRVQRTRSNVSLIHFRFNQYVSLPDICNCTEWSQYTRLHALAWSKACVYMPVLFAWSLRKVYEWRDVRSKHNVHKRRMRQTFIMHSVKRQQLRTNVLENYSS